MRMRTLNEAAEDLKDLNVTRHKLRRGIMEGRYPYLMWGNRYLVDVDQLRYILQREAEKKDTISLSECADALGLSTDTIRSMSRSGMIPCERSGRNYRYKLDNVKRALRLRMERGEEPKK